MQARLPSTTLENSIESCSTGGWHYGRQERSGDVKKSLKDG